MKLTVIGYWGAYPAQGSATSCYMIEKDGFTCLLDMGSGALSRLQAYKQVQDIDAIVISHYHNDHIADVGVLQYSWLVQNSLHNTNKVLPIHGHMEDEDGFNKLTHHYTKGIAFDPEESLEVGPFTIRFMKTNHPVPCYAMRVSDGEKDFVYTADTSYKEEFISFSEGADLLVTDCNFYEDQDGSYAGHMNSKQCAEIAQKAQVPELILSHHPHFGDRQNLVTQAKKYYDGEVTLASEGLTWGE